MASKGKKRKLEESKAPVRGSKEHVTACFKGLIVAACQDPNGWCHVGEENEKKGVDVYTPEAARELFPLPSDIPMAAIDLAATALKSAQSNVIKGVYGVFLLKTGEVQVLSDALAGVANLGVRWMDNARLQICKSGKDDKQPDFHFSTFKLNDMPQVSLPL
jgi:hypothetical protein